MTAEELVLVHWRVSHGQGISIRCPHLRDDTPLGQWNLVEFQRGGASGQGKRLYWLCCAECERK
jgi:hypothetical protein